ncbi:protein SGT1 homolog [Ruditapes philippinarum]|uniref:protein SGT1 homolog n=1 Tax=Ruditapes philippinarum TaxID=129788 RepID=UPI00295BE60D|nr:protein SGT1 homolog [Ruditapes philippinarum]
MATELFGKANDEFINENYQKALELYTEALDLERNRDDILCNRAQAHLKLEQYKEAAEDASEALALNPKNKKSWFRKGIALFHLEDYQSSKDAFTEGKVLDAEDNNFKTWIRKCEAELDLQGKSKEGQSNVGVSETKSEDKPKQESAEKPKVEETKPVVPMPTKEKSRYDWYQTQTHVVVTILLKNVKQEDANIDIQEKSLSATIKQECGSDYSLELDLSHAVVPEQSVVKVLKSKIEVKLKKKEGHQWHKLEGDESNLKQILAEESEHVKEYPSSSHYTRNWDKLAKDVEKEEENEKKEGDAALNELFQKIYADGTDETKKAMAKSFYESGGTVLSTNWSEIGAKKVEVKPPDGMEFKKWES